jgi:multiple sugar transport system permease protein
LANSLSQVALSQPHAKTARKRISSRERTLLLMLAPILLFTLAVSVYPLLNAFALSLTEYRLTDPNQTRTFVGLQNYLKAFRDPAATETILNTFLFVVGSVASQVVLGLGLAVLMSPETKFMRVVRGLAVIPMAIPPLVVGLVWKALLNSEFGSVAYYLKQIGLNPPRGFLGELNLAMPTIILIDLWQWTPLLMVIFLAGLKSLPTEINEAAYVDGASRWQAFTRITLPMLAPVIFIGVLLRTMNSFKIFDVIYVSTGGGPGNATAVLNFYIYKVGLTFFDMGYASALANILLVMIGLCCAVYIVLLERQKRSN